VLRGLSLAGRGALHPGSPTEVLERCLAPFDDGSLITGGDVKTNEQPLLLLDVDGVVCPLGEAANDQIAIAGTYVSLSHHRLLPVWLAELANAFELVWATTWEDDANAILSPLLGLPDLPVIGFRGTIVGPGETVKLPPVRRFVGDRAFAWVDDRLGVDAIAWAAHRPVATFLRDIDPATGLTRRDIDALLEFARRLEN
jgi:hypothetical protein